MKFFFVIIIFVFLPVFAFFISPKRDLKGPPGREVLEMDSHITSLEEKNKELKEQVEQLNVLFEEVLKFNSVKNHDILLKEVMDAATRVMKAEASSLMLLDEEKDELVFEVALGEKKSFLSKLRIKAGEGIAGQVLKDGVPLLVPDVDKDPRFSGKVDELTGFKTKSILCVPLRAEGKIIGVVQALNKADGRVFTEEDVRIFTNFAGLAALSIQNNKIYNDLQTFFLKESQQQISRLEVMSQISGVTLSSIDFSNIFKAIMEIVIQALQAESGIIFLISEQEKSFFPVVFRGFEDVALVEKDKLGISEKIVRDILRTGEPLKVEGFTDSHFETKEKLSSEDTQSVIGIPINSSNITFGVIVVFSRKGGDISLQDISFLKTFSGQLASTIEKLDLSMLEGGHKAKAQKVDFSVIEPEKNEVNRLYLEAIAEYMDKGVVVSDNDFNISLVNRRAEMLMGLKGEELLNQNCISCHSFSLQDDVSKVKERFLGEEKLDKLSFTKEFRAVNKKVKADLYPIKDLFSNNCGFFMIMEEILQEDKVKKPLIEKAKKESKTEKSKPEKSKTSKKLKKSKKPKSKKSK